MFEVGVDGPAVVWRCTATEAEERALDRATTLTAERLQARGIDAQIVSQRLNRRKIDLIPEPAWADPPKARFAALVDALTARLHKSGMASLADVVVVATDAARDGGLADPQITSDVKHVEMPRPASHADVHRAESACRSTRSPAHWYSSGATSSARSAGLAGSDSFMVVPELSRAAVVSVGVEPEGTPHGVRHLAGGPHRFIELLDDQLARRAQRRVPPSIRTRPGSSCYPLGRCRNEPLSCVEESAAADTPTLPID